VGRNPKVLVPLRLGSLNRSLPEHTLHKFRRIRDSLTICPIALLGAAILLAESTLRLVRKAVAPKELNHHPMYAPASQLVLLDPQDCSPLACLAVSIAGRVPAPAASSLGSCSNIPKLHLDS